MRRLLIAFASVCLGLFLPTVPARSAPATTIPDVHFAIFRFAADTQALVGFYEFSQPYRKALPDPGYTQSTNLLYAFAWGGDFGQFDADSRLTGERILSATMIWMGTGTFVYPPAAMMSTTLQHGFTNPAPEAVISPGIPYPTDANAAWALAQDTDVIARLAAHGTYEVYAWLHMYADGGAPPLNEIFIIAATHPVAPDDMAVLKVAWPRTLVTRGMPVTPEVVVHNFGDAPKDLKVNLALTGDPNTYNAMLPIGVLPADESRTITMPSMTVYGGGTKTLNGVIRTLGGGTWTDLYPDNDAVLQSIQVTDQPVFRSTSALPREGVPCDFDDDGDIDLVVLPTYLEFWQNDGAGNFTDITALSSFPVQLHPRFALCEDFNGDGHPDVFVTYWSKPGVMLAGDGSGAFTDVTAASGLSGIITYSDMLAVDKENDGDLDLFITSHGQEPIMENDGSGHFTNVAPSGLADSGQTSRMAVGDLNGDGYPDLALANWERDAAVFINDGDGTFTKLNRAWAMTYQRDVVLFDYDGDDDDDIFFLQNISSPSTLYRNDGGLIFTAVAPPAGGFPSEISVDAGDFNEDGKIDLVFTNGTILRNTGSAFVNESPLLVEHSLGWLAMGADIFFTDLNNDGDVDVYGEVKAYMSQGAPSLTGVGDTPARAASNWLEQNFPNPFNPTTTIRYRIGASGPVTLAIYNVAGQLVRTLVNETQQSGTRTVVWEGRNNSGEQVASGVYLCRLVTPGFSQTRKLVLLK